MHRPRREPHALVAALLSLCAMAWAGAAAAVEVEALTVDKQGARYRVDMRVMLDASPQRAYAVFSDYRNLPRINGAVRRIEVQSSNPQFTRLFTEVHACFSFYCKSVKQLQDMRASPSDDGGELTASVLPASSDFHYGDARWRIRDCRPKAKTCLEFHAELEPKFWIPPLIGPWIMQRKLRQEAMQTSEGIERLAREATDLAPA